MDIKTMLDNYFKNSKKQVSIEELIRILNIGKEEVQLLLDSLYELEKDGKIIFDHNHTYMHVPSDFCYYFGILEKSNKNQYYVKLENKSFILIKDVGKARVGDTVFVSKISSKNNHPKNFLGKIERIVKKEHVKNNFHFIVKETLKKDGSHFYINHDENRIYIPKEKLNTAFAGDVVNVRVSDHTGSVVDVLKRHRSYHVFRCISVEHQLKWVPIGPSYGCFELNKNKFLEGDIVLAEVNENYQLNFIQKLEQNNSIYDDINALIIDFSFAEEFSNKLLEEARTIVYHSKNMSFDDRVDLRNLETFTIDPVNAKDLDDAVSLIVDGDISHLYVHAANPSHYIKMGSSIFNEALKRGFSVYPSSNVIPMLPDIFCSGVCSLNEDGDKLAITCRMDIDRDGKVVHFEIFKSIIRNNKQMNYDMVNDLFDGKCNDSSYLSFYDTLIKMKELASILQDNKLARGSITFGSEEREFVLDGLGNPVAIKEKQRGEAQSMIENFMLLANETISKYAYYLGLPYIYRNHEKPTVQKSNNLKYNLDQKGYFIQKIGNINHPEILQRFLNYLLKGKNKAEKKVIFDMVLKTMTRAYYSDTNEGHYGLALDCYGTFTSPARKSTDYLNHMVIEEFLDHGIESKKLDVYREFIGDICEYLSEKQKDADLLEQAIDQLMLEKYAENFLLQEVNARVLFMNRYGIYVKDEHDLTGVIPITRDMLIHDQCVYFRGSEYRINGQISVILKGKNDNEFVYAFAPKKVKTKTLTSNDHS